MNSSANAGWSRFGINVLRCGAVLAALGTLGVGCAAKGGAVDSSASQDGSDALSGGEAVARAMEWVDAQLQYCNAANGGPEQDKSCFALEGPSHRCNRESNPEWDPYRSDCSGLVSWAWELPPPGRSTQGFAPYDNTVSHQIDANELQAGDAVNLRQGDHHHIILFGNWEVQGQRATFLEEPGCGSTPHARKFTANVQINGDGDILVEGYWMHAIRFNGIDAGGSPPPPPPPPAPTTNAAPPLAAGDLVGVKMNGTPGTTEVHTLSASSNWQDFTNHTATGLGQTTSGQWSFALGDSDRDGQKDLFAIAMNGTGSGQTEVHVLSAASDYAEFSVHAATPLGQVSPDNWQFTTGDFDGDGVADVFAIGMNGTGTGTTEVHVLPGASGYGKWSLETGTPLEMRDASRTQFLVGDYDRDGVPDLWIVEMNQTGSNMTELHVLSGASNFQTWLLHTATGLTPVDAGTFRFSLADTDGDGQLDLVAIATYATTGSGKTDIHVLSAASGFADFIVHTSTALEATTTSQWWFGTN